MLIYRVLQHSMAATYVDQGTIPLFRIEMSIFYIVFFDPPFPEINLNALPAYRIIFLMPVWLYTCRLYACAIASLLRFCMSNIIWPPGTVTRTISLMTLIRSGKYQLE